MGDGKRRVCEGWTRGRLEHRVSSRRLLEVWVGRLRREHLDLVVEDNAMQCALIHWYA